jgi:hypothetical protein
MTPRVPLNVNTVKVDHDVIYLTTEPETQTMQRQMIGTYLLTHGAEPFLTNRQLWSHSKTSQHFMEPEVSIPCSQESSTCPYPEPYQSNPQHPILSI